MESRVFIVGLIVGILATITMDVVAVIAIRLGIAGRGPRRTGPDLIGRWDRLPLTGQVQAREHPGDAAFARRTSFGTSRALCDRDRADPCVPSTVDCGAGDADSSQCYSLRNGHHGLPLVSHVPVTRHGLAGTGCAG